jgi:hypothetical protein
MTTALTPLAALIAARAIIADPAHWTTRAFARTYEIGNPREVEPNNPAAECFCALGALMHVNDQDSDKYLACCFSNVPGINELETAAYEHPGEYDNVSSINDGPEGHPKVMALYDMAIKKLEQP